MRDGISWLKEFFGGEKTAAILDGLKQEMVFWTMVRL